MMPQPTDDPRVHIAGPDPDRMLVLGGGLVLGFGVLSHELGIAGHLARQVASSTGRGLDVDIIAQPDFRVDDAGARLNEENLSGYDAIVLFLGVTDSVRHTSARSWHQGLAALLSDISDRTAAGARVFVVGIQPVRLVTTLNNRVGFFAELHARVLERETILVCAEWPNASFVPFRPEHEPTDRYRTSAIYGKWAALVSPAIIESLERNHPMGDFAI